MKTEKQRGRRGDTGPSAIEQSEAVAGATATQLPSDVRRFLPDWPAAKPHCVIVRPFLGPDGGLDVTDALVRAVAQELWNLHGGNEVMNWLEAERLLHEALAELASPLTAETDELAREPAETATW